MFNFITSNLEMLSFIVALSALLISIYSVIYTHRFNKRRIDIDECYIDFGEKYPLISFSINNLSPVPIRVRSLTFFNSSGTHVRHLDYTPVPTPMEHHEFADPLQQVTAIPPNESLEVSYFFENPDKVSTVTVLCKERIYHLHKQRTFELNPVRID